MTANVKKSLLGLCLLFLVMMVPQPAEAINISLKNPYPQTLFATVVYFEDASGKWVTQGWYKVDPRSSRNLNFSSSTQRIWAACFNMPCFGIHITYLIPTY